MKAICKDNIINLFVWLDDYLKLESKQIIKRGRPSVSSDSDVLTILIWSSLTEGHQRLTDIYAWIQREYQGYFRLATYKNFCQHVHRLLPQIYQVLNIILNQSSKLRFADSTMLPVCRQIRANRHKTAGSLASWGKNASGWHFGFKLHLSINSDKQLCALFFSGAHCHDNSVMENLINWFTKILVGDSHDGGSVQRKYLFKKYGLKIIAPPHFSQKTKLMTLEDRQLLRERSKIEAVFGILKQKFSLVTSYPRSIRGYLVHYLRVLLGYQMSKRLDLIS